MCVCIYIYISGKMENNPTVYKYRCMNKNVFRRHFFILEYIYK